MGDDPKTVDLRGFGWPGDLVRDVTLAARGLRHAAGFTAVVVLSLAIAIAAATVTAVVYAAYLVRPLYAEGDRLYHVQYAPPGPWEPSSLANLDWRAVDDVVELPITAAGDRFYTAERGGFSAPYRLIHASQSFIDGLGVGAQPGRTLVSADYEARGEASALISHRLWRDRFDRDPGVVGRQLAVEVDGQQRRLETFRIVGVLPDGFWFGSDSRDLVDLVAPLRRPATTYRVRLRRGVPVSLAERRITEAVRQVAGTLPATWAGVTLESARDRYVAGVRPVLRATAVTCAVIVAIACANVGVLALLRVARRQREIAVRLALGAGRGRIASMLGMEAALLVFVAAAGGLALAGVALDLTGPEIARQLGRPAPGGEGALRLGADALTIAAGVSLLGALAIGGLPLTLRALRRDPRITESLRRDSRLSSEDSGARRWRLALVALQVSGTLTLLVGGALAARSVINMVRTDFGVRTDGLVRVAIDFPSSAETDPEAVAARYRRLTDALAKPAGGRVPLFQWPQFAEAPTQPIETDGTGAGRVDMAALPVGLGYFDTLGIRLVDGRLFTTDDRLGSPPTAIVSRTAAERLWPGATPLGRQVLVADRYISGVRTRSWRTVVGVVADVRQTYDDGDLADIYVPFEQAPPERYAWFYMPIGREGPVWEPEVWRIATSLDPRATVRVAVPLSEEAARLWASPRFMAVLIATLAAVSMLLAVVGIYGVSAFSMEHRARDIAIRWALGATGAAMARSLLTETAAVVAIGTAGGVGGAVLIGRVLATQLHGVQAVDLWTLAGGAVLVAVVAGAAAALPATRAALSDHLSLLSDV